MNINGYGEVNCLEWNASAHLSSALVISEMVEAANMERISSRREPVPTSVFNKFVVLFVIRDLLFKITVFKLYFNQLEVSFFEVWN